MTIKNLGLLIIDEEQRFGVRHKEQLKKFRTLVDVMTLSATPIPRTLHMAMAGIRDLSIILTPPENRQSIETYVHGGEPGHPPDGHHQRDRARRPGLLRAQPRADHRGRTPSCSRSWSPRPPARVAHGQMHEHELEDVMIDFLDRKFDVLVSTSIIESGLDMPNVNTIIINRADAFGLSQLYQLKGRVGRSDAEGLRLPLLPEALPPDRGGA